MTGCAGSFGSQEPADVTIPQRPSFMSPVRVQEPAVGQDAKEALAVCYGDLRLANSRLRGSRRWADELSRAFAGEP